MDEVFTPEALAAHWKCSRDAIYDLLRSKKLPGFKVGRSWRITAETVIRYERGLVR